MNALVDTAVISKLYEASRAGVRIDLIVRGSCCLKPGVPGVSDNIRVVSILDRFLEHSRIIYFNNGGAPEIYSGSADWMPRNFDGRVEVIYPVKARIMQPDGRYELMKPEKGQQPVRAQSALIAIARSEGIKSKPYEDILKKIGSKKVTKRRQ